MSLPLFASSDTGGFARFRRQVRRVGRLLQCNNFGYHDYYNDAVGPSDVRFAGSAGYYTCNNFIANDSCHYYDEFVWPPSAYRTLISPAAIFVASAFR